MLDVLCCPAAQLGTLRPPAQQLLPPAGPDRLVGEPWEAAVGGWEAA